MKARTARRIAQVFFFTLFLFFVVVTDLRYLKGYPVSLFLELDPLVSFATAITTHTIYMGLLWSVLLILPTLLFGRVFCNWVCPYGILHHFIGWLLGKRRAEERERIEANRYKKLYSLKYVILIAMIVAAICGSLQIGWLDPICLFHRSMTVAILPDLEPVFPVEHLRAPVFPRRRVGRWLSALVPGRHECGHPAVFLPGALPARRVSRHAGPGRPLAHRPRPAQMRGLRPLPEKLRRRVRSAHAVAQERMFRLLQLHRGLSGGRHFVQVHAAAAARNHRASRAGPARVSRHLDRTDVLRLWPGLRRVGPELRQKGYPPARVRWRKRIFSIAASNATNASASARRTCCNRQ